MPLVYIIAGSIALAASTAMAVMASGGIHSPSAPGLFGMLAVLLVGAAAVGQALRKKLFALGIVIGLGMIAGDVAALVQTAQRTAANREAIRAPIAGIATQREATEKLLATAKAAKPEPADQLRLKAALEAKRLADAAVIAKSAEKHCVATCKALLQAAVEAAQREVGAARVAIGEHDLEQRQRIAEAITKAEDALAALKPAQSATPLANSTGIPEWMLDVVEAVALAFSLNIPASALIALGVKLLSRPGGVPQPAAGAKSETTEPALVPVRQPRARAVRTRRASNEAARFASARLGAAGSGSVGTAELRLAYENWCEAERLEPLPIEDIAPALGRLFRRAGIEIVSGRAIGVRLLRGSGQEQIEKACKDGP